MNAVRIIQNFHVREAELTTDGGHRDGRHITFVRGQSIPLDEVPAGQSAQDWIDKGLAEALD